MEVEELAKRAKPLQWGHGDEAVEEIDTDETADEKADASMGPRR